MPHVITWLDLQGRYRVTSPAYADLARLRGFSEDDALNWVWTSIVQSGLYGIDFEHPHHIVEDVVQRAKIRECVGHYFRWPCRPDSQGHKDGMFGAWRMALDGTPDVDMVKGEIIHRNHIEVAYEREQGVLLPVAAERAAAFYLSDLATPQEMYDAWPVGLEGRV